MLVECLFEPLEAFAVFAHGADVCLQDDVLSWCGTAHCGEPSAVGRAPVRPAHVPDVVPEQAGFETQLGVLKVADGLFTCPGESPPRRLCDLGDLHGGEIAGAGQTGQLPRIAALSCDPVARGLSRR